MISRLAPYVSLAALFLGGSACGGASTGAAHAETCGTPSSLSAVDRAAGQVYHLALSHEFDLLAQRLADLEESWRSARERAGRDGAPAPALRAVGDAVVALRWAATDRDSPEAVARAANRASAAVRDLAVFYRPHTPSRLLDLGVLGRDLFLDGLAGDLTSASEHVTELESAWTEARSGLAGVVDGRSIESYDASVRALRDALAARDAERLSRIADRSRELAAGFEEAVGCGS